MIANGDDEGLGNNNNNNDCDNHHGDSMTIELDHHLVGINDQPLQLFFFTTIAFFLGLVSSHHTALHYKSYSDDDDDSISFPNPLLCISTYVPPQQKWRSKERLDASSICKCNVNVV